MRKERRKGKAGKIALGFFAFLIVCGVYAMITGKGNTPAPVPAAAPVATSTVPVTAAPVVTEAPVVTSEPAATAAPLVADWDAVFAQVRTALTDSEFFPYVRDVAFTVDEKQKALSLSAVVDDSTSGAVALGLADTMLRRLSAVACMYNSALASPTKDYYGGLYDTYTAAVGVAPASSVNDTSAWFVNSVVYAGTHTKQAPVLQKK